MAILASPTGKILDLPNDLTVQPQIRGGEAGVSFAHGAGWAAVSAWIPTRNLRSIVNALAFDTAFTITGLFDEGYGTVTFTRHAGTGVVELTLTDMHSRDERHTEFSRVLTIPLRAQLRNVLEAVSSVS